MGSDLVTPLLMLAAVVGGNVLTLWLVSAVGPVRGLVRPLVRRVWTDLVADATFADKTGEFLKSLKTKGWF